jgi:hypothetical protein
MSKYAALGDFLRQHGTSEVPITFDKIEKITGTKLPPSAKRHRAWWSNNPDNSVMTRVWLDAGFRSERVDLAGRRLIFRRVTAKPAGALATEKSDVDRRPAVSKRHPMFGWLKGTVRVAPGVDLTEPADPEWADMLDK